MDIDQCFTLGVISKTHGLQGNVTVQIDAKHPEEYEEMDSVFLEIKGKLVPFFISSISINSRAIAIVKFDFIDHIDDAKEIVGCRLFLPLECMPQLGESEFYNSEIIGFKVNDTNLGYIGVIEDIIDYPNNQLFKIDRDGIEVLIPIADDLITGIDKAAKTLEVTTPEGLLDLYLD